MSHRQRSAVVALLLVAVLLVAGCAPRPGAGDVLSQAGEGEIVVDLPAMVIDYDLEGRPSVGGVPLSSLGMLPASVVEQITLDADIVGQLQDANIQNVQVNNQTNGLTLFVNGAQIPSLSWDKESLATLASLAGAMGPDMAVVADIAPLLTNLGFAAVLRIPPAEGVEELPITTESEAATAAQAAADAFVSEVGTPPQIHIPVTYDATGDWTVSGITADEWTEMTGAPFDALKLEEDIVTSLKDAGITSITVASGSEGLQMALNGNNLPYLDWSGGKLGPAIELLAASGQLDSLAEQGMNLDALMAVLDQLLPVVTSSNVSIDVTLE